jgi:hypothetical protein
MKLNEKKSIWQFQSIQSSFATSVANPAPGTAADMRPLASGNAGRKGRIRANGPAPRGVCRFGGRPNIFTYSLSIQSPTLL